MSHTLETVGRSMFATEPGFGGSRHVPILPSATTAATYNTSDAMDITPPAAGLHSSSPDVALDNQRTRGGNKNNANGPDTGASTNGPTASTGAGSGQTTKVVQTAFIHKLYSMLEDQSIKGLISWSDAGDSFCMLPSPDFSKVLSQYFKHTNISSFVRQLNMYGFHKVSDVFQGGQTESAWWEFKHGGGNFKRGDLTGLREIKRRASKHALIQRPESFMTPHKPSISQPGTPAEPVPELPAELRLANVENSLYDLHARLMRTEESNTALSTKCAILNETLMKYHHWNTELASIIGKLIPEHDGQLANQVSSIHKDMLRHAEMLQRTEEHHDPLMSSRPYFQNLTLDAGSLSPRQRPQDDRRGSIQTMPVKTGFFRTPAPPQLAISPRRFGSIGTQGHSPSYRTPSQHQPPPTQHPLASVEPSPGLARRHTSADIRDSPGWPPRPGASPFEAPSTATSSNWPSSPQPPLPAADPSIQNVLASYSLSGPRQSVSGFQSRQASPPPPESAGLSDNGFPFRAPNYGPRLTDNSQPPTRRGSIAHLLNINESAASHDEDGNDDRKRKRV